MVLLPHAPSSIGLARHALGAELRAHGVPEAAVADATLVLSELLSNAIRHARPLPGGVVEVAWTLNGGSLEMTVTDGGGPTRPHVVMPPPSAPGGRGLSIVGHLSRGWGVRSDDRGTTVWAVLPAGRGRRLRRRSRRRLARARPAAG